MRFSSVFILGVQISSIVALPAHSVRRSQVNAVSQPLLTRNIGAAPVSAPQRRSKEEDKAEAAEEKAAEPAKVGAGKATEEKAAAPAKVEAGEAAKGAAKPAKVEAGKAANETAAVGGGAKAGEEAAAGEEEKLAGEKELAGVFGTAVALEGGDIKQDVVFTASAIGKFEFEFQGKAADALTVTENKTPAAPPAGFVAVEPSSFQVALGVSKGAGLTLSKIDYIFDGTNAALAAMDLTQAKVGKLCADTGSFVIEETLGELEFEAEENEVTLNLNKAVTSEGEWGIFLPAAAAGAAAGGDAAAGGEAAAGEGAKAGGEAAAGEGAKAGGEAKAGEKAAGGEAKAGEKAAGEGAKAGEAKVEAAQPAAGGAVDLVALIDALRQGKASVPAFVAPARR
ncbi:hypothetical protein IFR05_004585 [Cadophora sp. M221]|nr:hypothetical protein IFR05_004585 [Cadophora sp. M221]